MTTSPIATNRRSQLRFEKAFPVLLISDFGYLSGVCRNFSVGGMAVEMGEPLPLGTRVKVRFPLEGVAGFIATADVKHQYYFNYSESDLPSACRGIGLRFVDFLVESEVESFTEPRVMH